MRRGELGSRATCGSVHFQLAMKPFSPSFDRFDPLYFSYRYGCRSCPPVSPKQRRSRSRPCQTVRPSLSFPLHRLHQRTTADPVRSTDPVRVVLDDRPTTYGDDPFLRCKTSRREVYDSARARCGASLLFLCSPRAPLADSSSLPSAGATLHPSPDPAAPPFDVLLLNPSGELTESSISNVAFRLAPSTPFITPRAECGLLEGVMRAELLERGEVQEGRVRVDEVKAAAKVRPTFLSRSHFPPHPRCVIES